MPQRRESGRAVSRPSKKRPKAASTQKPRAQSQSSTGSNAAAAHGYTQKGPTRKLKPAKTETLKGPQSLKVARESAPQRTPHTTQVTVDRATPVKIRTPKGKPDKPGILHRVVRVVEHGAADAAERVGGPGVKAATDLLASKKPKVVERELAGAGELAKASQKAADFVTKNGAVISTGAGGGAAGAALNRKAKKEGGRTMIAAAVPRQVKAPKILVNATNDIINGPAQALPSIVVPGEAAAKALRGDSKPLKKYVKDAAATDPIVQLATGHPGKAAKLAQEHPGFTALEVAGLKGTGGRAVSRTARGTGKVLKAAGAEKVGTRVHNVGATHTRPDAVVPETNLREVRTYSRDASKKATQILKDKHKAKQAGKLREQAKTAKTAEKTQQLLDRANKVDPHVMSDQAINRHVDQQEAATESRRRRQVDDVKLRAQKIVKKSGDDGAALNLVTQGITEASVADLRRYQGELERTHGTLEEAGKRKANKHLRDMIDKSISRAQNGRIRKLDMDKIRAAANEFSETIDKPLDRRLADLGIIDHDRAVRAKLIPGAARKGARVDAQKGVVDAEGRPMSNEQLHALRADAAVEPSYLSQQANARGAGAYYRSTSREPTVSAKKRTENATLEGTFDTHPETLPARAAKAEGIASAAEGFRATMSEVALRKPDGSGAQLFSSRDRAQTRADSIHAETGRKMVPVQWEPWGVSKAQREAMQHDLNRVGSDAAEHSLHTSLIDALSEHKTGGGDETGRYVLIPEAAAARMAAHVKVLDPSDVGKVAQALRGAFSRTVLATSPSPVIGNALESGFRMGVERAGPRSYLTTRRVLKRMSPDERASFEDRVMPGGRITLQATSRHFDANQLAPGSMREIARGWGAVKRAPVNRTIVAAWNQWNHLVMGYVNGKIERGAQATLAGKAIRDSGLLGDSIIKLSNKAMDQAARGLVNTAEQNALAKELHRTYGQYSALSPMKRRVIAQYTPFAAWWLSSVRFVGTLPIHHPTLTLLAAANERAVTDWEKFNATPAWLRGTAEIGKTKWQVSRNTPFGAFTDPIGTAGSLILPQLVPMIMNANGLDWKGTKLRNSDGSDYSQLQLGGQIAKTMAESSVPIYAAPERVAGYVKDPSKLLNAVRVRNPSTGTSAPVLRPSSKPSSTSSGGSFDTGGQNFDTGGSFNVGQQNFGG